jgi:hypothetical protein
VVLGQRNRRLTPFQPVFEGASLRRRAFLFSGGVPLVALDRGKMTLDTFAGGDAAK